MRRVMKEEGDIYTAEDGHVMKREEGLTPNGNPINGRWVLRSPDKAYIDVDTYRLDLANRHGFDISYE